MKYLKNYLKSNVIKATIATISTILILLFSFNYSALAAKQNKKTKQKNKKTRVVFNQSKTKAEALEILKSSEEVANIAGLEHSAAASTISSAYIDVVQKDTISTKNISDVELLKQYMNAENEEVGEEGEDLDELDAEDDVVVNLEDFRSIWLLAIGATGNSEGGTTSFGVDKEELMSTMMNWFGTPYHFGGITERGIDCSAWVQTIFYQTCSVVLPRTAREQINLGKKITKRDKLEFGDLVFFHTYTRRFASHVGIYLGDNLFAHASSRKGVTVSSLQSTFYDKRFIGGRRLNKHDIEHNKIAINSNKLEH